MDSCRHFYLRFQFFQIIPETVRQQNSVNYPYLCTSYPTQNLKNLHRRKGGGCLGSCIKIYRALGTLHPKRTFNRIAANYCSEPKPTGAARHANVCTLGERPLIGASGSIYRGFPEIFLFLLHALRCWSAHKGSCLQLLRCETD